MGILDDLRTRVQAVNDGLTDMVRSTLTGHGEDVMEMQRMQLFQGKSSSGEDLRPYYSEDLKPKGYFHSVESAKRYAAWKQHTPYSAQRNPDAPNLYINGKFHSELGVDFGARQIKIAGRTPYARVIVAKYGIEHFGLTEENWEMLFRERGLYEELMDEIRQTIYGN